VTASESARISLEPAVEGAVWLTLDRPETRNAMDWQTLDAFSAALDEAEASAKTRVVLVRSALDRVFVAGGDIAVMRDLQLLDGSRFVYAGQRLLRRLEESRLVFIAAVGGYAPGWGGTQRIVRAISPQRARELVYTGRRIDATEAYDYGFVNRVVPASELELAVVELATAVTRSSPAAVSQSKRALVHGSRASLDQGLVIEAEAWLANLSSPNRVEGLSAFLEKREPHFTTE
jgi:enoyl-CoA hydratase/carnithine racemase